MTRGAGLPRPPRAGPDPRPGPGSRPGSCLPRRGRGGRRRELYFARRRLSRRTPPGTPTGSGGAGSAAGPGPGRPSGRFLIWLLGCGGAGGARSAAEPAGAAARCQPLPPSAEPAASPGGPGGRWRRAEPSAMAPGRGRAGRCASSPLGSAFY